MQKEQAKLPQKDKDVEEPLVEGGSDEDSWSLDSDIGPSVSERYSSDSSSSEGEFEGGDKTEFDDDFLVQKKIFKEGDSFYIFKQIEDKGFNKWTGAYDSTANYIKWVSLFVSFKFYRMTYSYFMGRKQFLVLYQKKKFKKNTVLLTLLSQFFVELPIIICDVVAISALPMGQ